MHYTLVDANNYLRRKLETQTAPLRHCYMEEMNRSNPVIWVWDGMNCNARRREVWPDYKRGRKELPEDIGRSLDLFKEILSYTKNVVQIEVPDYEADDVIATLTRAAVKTGEVEIISTDKDFFQLVGPRVRLDREPWKVAPQDVRLYKTLVGDPSDNIPGLKGFGEKAWASLPDGHKRAIEKSLKFEAQTNDDILSIDDKLYGKFVENFNTLANFWQIVGFYDVPEDQITKGTTDPTNRPDKAHALMREFML
jgi:5'-3' exonuclease